MDSSATISVGTRPKSINGIAIGCFRDERWRLSSFRSFDWSSKNSPTLLAQEGFMYIGSDGCGEGQVMCYFCWNLYSLSCNVLEEHQKCRDCPMLTGISCKNIPFNGTQVEEQKEQKPTSKPNLKPTSIPNLKPTSIPNLKPASEPTLMTEANSDLEEPKKLCEPTSESPAIPTREECYTVSLNAGRENCSSPNASVKTEKVQDLTTTTHTETDYTAQDNLTSTNNPAKIFREIDEDSTATFHIDNHVTGSNLMCNRMTTTVDSTSVCEAQEFKTDFAHFYPVDATAQNVSAIADTALDINTSNTAQTERYSTTTSYNSKSVTATFSCTDLTPQSNTAHNCKSLNGSEHTCTVPDSTSSDYTVSVESRINRAMSEASAKGLSVAMSEDSSIGLSVAMSEDSARGLNVAISEDSFIGLSVAMSEDSSIGLNVAMSEASNRGLNVAMSEASTRGLNVPPANVQRCTTPGAASRVYDVTDGSADPPCIHPNRQNEHVARSVQHRISPGISASRDNARRADAHGRRFFQYTPSTKDTYVISTDNSDVVLNSHATSSPLTSPALFAAQSNAALYSSNSTNNNEPIRLSDDQDVWSIVSIAQVPIREHASAAVPNTPHVNGSSSVEAASSSTSFSCGVSGQNPTNMTLRTLEAVKYRDLGAVSVPRWDTQLALADSRRETLVNLQNYSEQDKTILANAGIMRIRQKLRCYWCNCKLEIASVSDVKLNHSTKSPACRFSEDLFCATTTSDETENLSTRFDPSSHQTCDIDPVVLALLEQGYTEDDDVNAMESSFTTAIEQMAEKNEQLRKRMVCKICYENKMNVLLLPCGHLVGCLICVARLETCPVCRSKFQWRVLVNIPK
ncbi:mucin-2-like [Physella acuta]|uniref:mucin-2-like n=1 Tax=Physella acuta TaxID=109671 RepID=UPI0027DCC201|nr:mucin-2-like [Physella acuta]